MFEFDIWNDSGPRKYREAAGQLQRLALVVLSAIRVGTRVFFSMMAEHWFLGQTDCERPEVAAR